VLRPAQAPDIEATVKKAIDGDVEAYGCLYSLFVDRIFRYIFYQVGDKMAAEDITEEVFMKTWRSIRTCKGKENTFSAWLYRIAHNHLIDTCRKNRKTVSFENIDLPDDSNPQQQAEENFERQKVLEAVKVLPENQKQVILLKFIEGIDNAEISRIMGKQQGAIRAIQMRALSSLRAKFNPGEESHDR